MNQSNSIRTLEMIVAALALVMLLALAVAMYGARVAATADTRRIEQR
jgi:hypothetical protein